MTYSGNFKARGVNVDCVVTSKNNWQTIDSISYDVGTQSINTVISVSLDDGSEVTLNGGVGNAYTAEAPIGSNVSFKVTADGSSSITVAKDISVSYGFAETGSSPFTSAGNQISSGENRFSITVAGVNTTTVYSVNITGV